MTAPLTRRRFIAISAAATASCAGAGPSLGRGAATWRGVALGASASIRIEGLSSDEAADMLDACVQEISRLEAIFSLYRRDSALSRLNRDGALLKPAPDLLAVISTARGVNRVSGGAFDPTIQPIWDLYARHFRQGAFPATAGPPPERVENALKHVGLDKVVATPAAIRFRSRGMALTLNGIAQGYITDRVADLLRSHGVSNVLVNVGEIRALGGPKDRTHWAIGIADPNGNGAGGRQIALADQAIATSATSGTAFDGDGRFGHIIDPRSGYPAQQRRQVSVVADSTTLADAYSTAFCLLDPHDIRPIAEAAGLRVVEV